MSNAPGICRKAFVLWERRVFSPKFSPKKHLLHFPKMIKSLAPALLAFLFFALPLLAQDLSSQSVPSESGQDIKISLQNFDELVKHSDWLIRSNQRALSQKLLSDLLAFANAQASPQNLIQVYHAYGRYSRYYRELDAAKLHGDKLLELIEQEGVTDVEKALVYAFCGELASITVNTNNDNDFKTAIALCEKGLALVGHLEYSPIKASCKYCIEQSLSAFNRNTDYERTHALPKIRQLWHDALANNDSLNSLKIGLKVLDYCRGL